jgi:hypothetical protein
VIPVVHWDLEIVKILLQAGQRNNRFFKKGPVNPAGSVGFQELIKVLSDNLKKNDFVILLIMLSIRPAERRRQKTFCASIDTG